MKIPLNWRRIFLAAGAIALFMVEAIIWMQTLSDNALRTGADFIAFYTAGRIAQAEGIAQVYKPELQHAVQQAQVGFELGREQVLLYNHLPYVIPLTMLTVNENYVTSFMRWNLLMLIVLGTATGLLVVSVPGLQREQTWLAIIGSLLFFPTFYSLVNGQDTALLFLGGALGVWGILKQRDTVAGLGLSLVTVRPHLALLFAIPFFFKRRNVFWGFATGATGLALLSIGLLNSSGTRDFLHILSLSASGEWHGMQEEAMFNLLGILRRLIPMLDPQIARTTAWGVYGIAILCLSALWFHKKEITEKELSLMVILGLFVAPHLHYHDLTLLLVPLFLVLRINLTRNLLTAKTAAILPLSMAVISLTENLIPLLKYTVPYLLMLGLLLALWRPEFFLRFGKNSTFDSNL